MTKSKYLLMALAALCAVGCSDGKFHVEGAISQAADSVLYFEHMGISETTVMDSVTLDADGRFSFSAERTAAPEFYRLRLGQQTVSLSIDSTETVTVNAQWPDLADGYTVEGSENCTKIRELSLKLMELRRQAMSISKNPGLSVDDANDSIISLIQSYKSDVKSNYIFKDPKASYAYFALFQTLGNMLLFNPRTDRDDVKVFAAVATSWDTYYPDAERGRNLHNIAIEGMNTVRTIEAAGRQKPVDPSKVRTSGIIDIELTDNHGRQRALSELKGSVVLLDFHVFSMKESPARILMLRELYNKYHSRGFEIYQVSLDGDEHFWKQQTEALPWVSVREPQGPSAPMLGIYNVQAVPEYFLIDRGSNLIGRSQQLGDIDAAVSKLL